MSQPAVCTATVADIKDDDFLLRVMHSIYDPIVPHTEPVEILCPAQFARARWQGRPGEVFNTLEDAHSEGARQCCDILLDQTRDLRIRPLLFVPLPELTEFYGRLFAPLRYNSKVVKVFLELFVLLQGKDHCDPIAVLINNILLSCYTHI